MRFGQTIAAALVLLAACSGVMAREIQIAREVNLDGVAGFPRAITVLPNGDFVVAGWGETRHGRWERILWEM